MPETTLAHLLSHAGDAVPRGADGKGVGWFVEPVHPTNRSTNGAQRTNLTA
jgi:hypothetical protein